MDAYERLLKVIRDNTPKANEVQLAVMTSPTSCTMNGLNLSGEDLLISEHLLTGWQNGTEIYPPLATGDTVSVVRLNGATYLILERMVSV